MVNAALQAWQSWKTARAIAVLSVIALSVGIGSTTAIYTVVNGVMLKPLPYRDGNRFVALFGGTTSEPERVSAQTFPDILEYERRSRSFEAFGWFKLMDFSLTSPGQPQHVNGAAVTPSLAHNLGVMPVVGQWFQDDTGAVISTALWRRLGAGPSIIGKQIILNGRGYTVTGVMPPGFRLPVVTYNSVDALNDVWIGLDPGGRGQNPAEGMYVAYARLKPGVTFAQAEGDVQAIAADIAQKAPATHPSYTARLWPLRETVVKQIRPTLLLLFAAAGLLLLITCANVSGLLLARSVARARETAIRVALGATRSQLAAGFFIEGLYVSLAGAFGGILVAFALVRAILALAAEFIPRVDQVAIDWPVVLFAILIACLASLLTSLAPLWQASRTTPNAVLNEGVRASAGLRSQRLSRALVVTEIALAFTLLAVSAVLIGHVRSLSRVPPGFDPAHLLTFQLTVPESIASKGEKRAPYQIALLESIKAIPGVTGAGFVNQLPLGGCCFGTTLYPDGRPPAATGETVAFLPVSPGYFQTMRIPLRAGRLLTYQDVSDDFLIAVINQAAAKRYWPDVNPLGAWGRLSSPTGSRFQVVGVVGDVRNDGLGKPTVPEIYMLASLIHVNPMYFVVRSPMSADALVPLVRRAVQAVDASQPLYNVASMDEIATQSLTFQRAGSFMITFFAAAALMLATLGVYGVVSYSVRQRTVEIGTRMALGALNRDLFPLVLGRGLKMAAYGTLLGAVAIVGAAWLLVRYLDIHELGMFPFAASTLIVGALAGFASFFPAWRAIRVSPLASIRNEPGSIWKSIRHATDSPAAVEAPVLTSFVDASRAAGSFPDALRMALESLKADLGATSAILIEDLSGHAFLQKRLKAYPYPLPVTEGDLETWLRWAKESRPEYVAELEALKNTDIRLAAALRTRDDIIGLLLLGAPVTREQYSYGERESVRHASQQLALMLENARLTQRVVEQEKLRRDLALASEVQRRLLPDKPPHPESADVAAVSLPARTIGGDYYDFIDVGDRCIGIALADIAGKGVAAALIMSVVQASLRIICSEEGISLPQIVAKLNRFLHKSTGTSSYATFFYAQLDDRTRQLRYVNAGHNPPYLLRGTEVLELPAGGTVVGLFPQMAYEEASLNLRPGDLLVAFTDGVTEALSPAEEEFGEDRLKALMREIAHMPVQEISARLSAELKNWIKDAAQYDDLTFVVLKVN